MNFMVEYLPGKTGKQLSPREQFERADDEFGRLGAAVTLVQLDPHLCAPGVDCPFAARPFSEDAVVLDVTDLAILTRYVTDTGRSVNVMAASTWESTNGGREVLTLRLFVSADGFCERAEL